MGFLASPGYIAGVIAPFRHPLPSLSGLRAFEAAARRGSFAAAATELQVSASAISQQIKVLERQLGVALFDRHAHGITLRSVGGDFAAEIGPQLLAIDQATARVRARGVARPLRITMMPPLAGRVVIPQLATFQARLPDVEIHVESTVDRVDLHHNTADLGLRYGTPPWPGCTATHITELYVQPVCPPALAAGLPDPTSVAAVLSLPLVHMTGRGDLWARYFREMGVREGPEVPPPTAPPVREYRLNDYPAAIEAAETIGAALALMPLERSLVGSGRVVAIGPPMGPLDEGLYAVTRDADRDDPHLLAFIDWVRERVAALSEG